MTRRKILTLWGNQEIVAVIRNRARMRFVRIADREDAESEAWERLQRAPGNLTMRAYHLIAHNAVEAYYRRALRLSKRETTSNNPLLLNDLQARVP